MPPNSDRISISRTFLGVLTNIENSFEEIIKKIKWFIKETVVIF